MMNRVTTAVLQTGVRLVGLAVLVALTVAPAWADSVLVPLPDEAAGPEALARPEVAQATRTIPLLTPESPSQYAAIKAAAAHAPGAQIASPIRPPSAEPSANLADVTTSFVGLDRPGAASNGFVAFPPDTSVAKSFVRVLEATNLAVRLFTTAGGVLATSTLNSFFGAPTTVLPGDLLFDPKVYFDVNAANRRFYVVALQMRKTGATTGISRIWLAVSRSSDPANLLSTSWCRYFLDARRNVATADESWADYPGLGAGADKLIISDNNFRFSTNTFTFAIVRSFNKLIAANNAVSCPGIPFHTFQPSATIVNGTVFTLQPVQHYTSPSAVSSPVGTTNPAYLINTTTPSGSFYRIWRVAGLPGSTGGVLQLVNVFGSFTYAIPPDAPQTGTAVLLDTGDNRVTQAAGNGNLLTGVHSTLCNLGGGANESCARVVQVGVGASGTAPTAFISQQSTFGFPGEFFFWPGVAVNALNQTIVPFQYVSPGVTGGRLSTWFSAKDSPTPFFTSILPLTTGTCPQTILNRTGDYVGAQRDPSSIFGKSTFWIAGERAAVIGGTCQWQTQIGQVDPGFNIIGFQPE